MTQQEAREIIMAQTQKAFADYDSIHGGITRSMTRKQMYDYAEARTACVNIVLVRDVPEDIRMLAV